MMTDVLKAMEARFSTRSYTEEKLTKEELDVLIKAGLQAPTATNRQEIHFSVLEGDNPLLAEIHAEMVKDRPGAGGSGNFYYSAPTVFILSGEAAFSWSPIDAGIAVENIALAAEGLGLGSVILGCIKGALNGEKKEYFAKALHFPEGYEFYIAVAVGHIAAGKTPHEYSVEKSVSIL